MSRFQWWERLNWWRCQRFGHKWRVVPGGITVIDYVDNARWKVFNRCARCGLIEAGHETEVGGRIPVPSGPDPLQL